MSKQRAADLLGVSLATVDRRILRGELTVEREAWGSRERVWVMLDLPTGEAISEGSSDASNDASNEVTMTVLRERVAALERELASCKQQLADSELRYHELLARLPVQLPPGPAESRIKGWFRFLRR